MNSRPNGGRFRTLPGVEVDWLQFLVIGIMTMILRVLIYRFERWSWHFDSISIRSISESDLKRNLRRLGFVMTVIDWYVSLLLKKTSMMHFEWRILWQCHIFTSIQCKNLFITVYKTQYNKITRTSKMSDQKFVLTTLHMLICRKGTCRQ